MDTPDYWYSGLDDLPEPDGIILKVGCNFYEVSWKDFIEVIKKELEK